LQSRDLLNSSCQNKSALALDPPVSGKETVDPSLTF